MLAKLERTVDIVSTRIPNSGGRWKAFTKYTSRKMEASCRTSSFSSYNSNTLWTILRLHLKTEMGDLKQATGGTSSPAF